MKSTAALFAFTEMLLILCQQDSVSAAYIPDSSAQLDAFPFKQAFGDDNAFFVPPPPPPPLPPQESPEGGEYYYGGEMASQGDAHQPAQQPQSSDYGDSTSSFGGSGGEHQPDNSAYSYDASYGATATDTGSQMGGIMSKVTGHPSRFLNEFGGGGGVSGSSLSGSVTGLGGGGYPDMSGMTSVSSGAPGSL